MGARRREVTRDGRAGASGRDAGKALGDAVAAVGDAGGAARRPRASAFAGALRREWRRRGWPEAGARAVVAVSGGADS
ncbi:MAG TPA: hypothetical protein VER32_15335, partial [Pyrinomonadaceae bacterium]|nr:hypothetical protein [Pyrinomonadaceae bacterium]